MKTGLFLLLIFLPGMTAKEPTSILFLGDSLTAGDGIKKEYSFPALINEKVEGVRSMNQGRSGWATSSYLRRWDEVENKLPEKVDFIFIQLGANDLRIDGHSNEVVQNCADNMKEIIARLEKIYPQAQIVLMSSTKIDYTQMNEQIRNVNFGKHTNNYINKIGKKYKKLAKDRGYSFIDLHHQIPMHSTHDGAHLNKEGHERVAEIISEYFVKLNED